MSKDAKIEIIYFKNNTDVALEFGLHGDYSMRLLASSCNEPVAFFHTLKRAIMRSEIIIIVGGYAENEYIPDILSKSIGKSTYTPELIKHNIISDKNYSMPKGAIPLAPNSRLFGGFLIESGPQTIISLIDDKKVRLDVIKEIVVEYIKEHHTVYKNYNDFSNHLPADSTTAQKEIVTDVTDEQPEIIENSDDSDGTDITADQPCEINNDTTDNDAIESNDDVYLADFSTASVNNEQQPSNENKNDDFVEDQNLKIDEIANKYKTDDITTTKNHLLIDNDDFDFNFNNKKTKRHSKKKTVRIISIILILIILFSSCAAVLFLSPPSDTGRSYYSKLNEIYLNHGDNYTQAFNELKKFNSSINGWISIDKTDISYPVTSESILTDFSYKVSHLPNGEKSTYGTVFSTTLISLKEYTGNMVFYGNADKNGAFSTLYNYFDKNYYLEHTNVTTANRYNKTSWEVFSVFKASDCEGFMFDRSAFSGALDYNQYIKAIADNSIYSDNIDLEEHHPIIVLVGIANNDKYVVAAKLSGIDEHKKPSVETNTDPIDPDTEEQPPNKVIIGINDDKDIYVGKDEDDDIVEQEPNFENEIVIPPATTTPPTSSTDTSSFNSVPSEPSVDSVVTDVSSDTSSVPSNIPSENTSSDVSSDIVSSTVTSVPSDQPSSNDTTTDITSSEPSVEPPKPTIEPFYTWDINVSVTYNGQVHSGSATDIVTMMIEAEMGSHYPIEALKAHAVASYNWLLNNGVLKGAAPSVYLKHSPENSVASQAVSAVKGNLLMYGDTVAQTNYSACSAGKTANNQHIWQWNDWKNTAPIPTLQSVDCSIDETVDGFMTTTEYTSDEVKNLIMQKYNIDVTEMPKTEWIVPILYDENNLYCVRVMIAGVEYKGPELRNVLFGLWSRTSNPKGLRSPAYTVSYDSEKDTFTIVCKGWGHGVGMSQYGAREYAKLGWTYEEILTHFFTGTHINKYI